MFKIPERLLNLIGLSRYTEYTCRVCNQKVTSADNLLADAHHIDNRQCLGEGKPVKIDEQIIPVARGMYRFSSRK